LGRVQEARELLEEDLEICKGVYAVISCVLLRPYILNPCDSTPR
jgi:hypothetical protein